ncbi:MAG: aldehyde dehydrogenase family protein, partial [Akkermansia sp.]|nr:aldehyde dehydrogenase family protein [Akkermansia sp.]
MMNNIANIQRRFFNTHATRDVKFRREALKKLRSALKAWEPRICEALQRDLGKCAMETFMTEIGMVTSSLNHTISNLRRWSKPRRVHTPLAQFPSVSRVVPDPYGVALIMSPWNYPVLLCLDPLVAAISAGNCCVVKPSSMTPATSAVLAEMLSSLYPKEYVHVVLGGRDSTGVLLEQKFDYIFFTGSPTVGHIIMDAAAR